MNHTNISLADLQYEIEEKDLYVKKLKLVSQDQWLEQERINLFEKQIERPEQISLVSSVVTVKSSKSDIETKFQNVDEPSLKENRSVLTLQSNFEDYKAECLKYMIPPCSKMSEIGEITEIEFQVH